MNKFNISYLLLLTAFFLTDFSYAQLGLSPVASVSKGITYPKLNGPYAMTTAVIDGSTYALVAGFNDDGVQIMELIPPPGIRSTKKSLTINANENAEWSTQFNREMNLPSIEQFLATKALRVGTATNIVTLSSGELLSIRYGETNGAQDKSILVFEIDVPYEEGDYLIRMQYGDTGYDNSGLTDIENGLAYDGTNASNGYVDTQGLHIADGFGQGVRIYPNPVKEKLHLVYEQAKEVQYTLHDLGGKQLRTTTKTGSTHSIEVSDLARGTYLLKATSGLQFAYYRFVKE